MNLTSVKTKNYANKLTFTRRQNEPKTNPIYAESNPILPALSLPKGRVDLSIEAMAKMEASGEKVQKIENQQLLCVDFPDSAYNMACLN